MIIKSLAIRFIFTILMVFIFPICANGNSKSPAQLQTIKVFFENDLFGNTDEYYTNAVQFTWRSNDLKQYKDDVRLPDWVLPVIRIIPEVYGHGRER